MDTNHVRRAGAACPHLPAAEWTPPALPAVIPQGDMPGDRIVIGEEHIRKANTLFPALLPLLAACENPSGRAVVTVCGGSGVGKSEIASILAYYLRAEGIGSYVLSGDNYPRRIPPRERRGAPAGLPRRRAAPCLAAGRRHGRAHRRSCPLCDPHPHCGLGAGGRAGSVNRRTRA